MPETRPSDGRTSSTRRRESWLAIWRYERTVSARSFADYAPLAWEHALVPLLQLAVTVLSGVLVGQAVGSKLGLIAALLVGGGLLAWSRVAAAAKIHAEQLEEIERLTPTPRPDLEFSDLRTLAGYDLFRILEENDASWIVLLDGSFVVVEVTNASLSRQRLTSILARIEYRDVTGEAMAQVEGLWSADPGPDFLPGGPREATIGFGDSRVLVIGLFSHRLRSWLQFARTDYPPDFARSVYAEEKLVHSTTGRRVDLGSDCEVLIRLTGDGVEEKTSWRLRFTEDDSITWERLQGRP